MYGYYSLLDDNLLRLHVVAVDEANHVNARCGIDGLADTAVDGLAAEDASVDINYLQGSAAFVADKPASIAIESKGI